MLPKKRRIPRELFPRILSESKHYNSQNLFLYSIRINQSLPSRFSFSISKKICKNAVDRNKYRRRGYSIINHHIKQIEQGYLCFFSFKKGSGKTTFKILEEQIIYLLHKASVLI